MSFLIRLSNLSRLSRVTTTSQLSRFTTIVDTKAEGLSAEKSIPAAGTSEVNRPHHAVVSISGRDRAGIIKSVSSSVTEYEANLEESKMAILGGDFAMILYVSMKEAADADRLASKIRMELPSFTVSVRETTAPTTIVKEGGPSGWTLSLEGPDNPGIISVLSEALAVNGCNVREMDTETTTAPFAGYELFKVKSKLSVDEAKLGELSDALDRVEEQFGSTISLTRD